MHQERTADTRLVSRVVLIALMLAMVGCGTAPERPKAVYESPPEEPEQTPAAVAPAVIDPGIRRAGDSLLADARGARADGALDRAEALLQRAQRIDPSNALIYRELAELYLQKGHMDASRTVAERGLLYCEGRDCDALRTLAAPGR